MKYRISILPFSFSQLNSDRRNSDGLLVLGRGMMGRYIHSEGKLSLARDGLVCDRTNAEWTNYSDHLDGNSIHYEGC